MTRKKKCNSVKEFRSSGTVAYRPLNCLPFPAVCSSVISAPSLSTLRQRSGTGSGNIFRSTPRSLVLSPIPVKFSPTFIGA